MPIATLIEHCLLISLVGLFAYVLWRQHQEQLKKLWEEAKKAARIPRKWKPKSPTDCPACQSGLQLAIRPIKRDVKPWRECKSRRGRRKHITTDGQACPNPPCRYFGITDEAVHALCWRHCYAMFRQARQTEGYPDLQMPMLPDQFQFTTEYPPLSLENPPRPD